MTTKTELHEEDAAADAWLPETVDVKLEDDFAPEFARVQGAIRKTPAAVVLAKDRGLLANHLPFWDDLPDGMSRPETLSRGQPGDCQYTI